MREEKSLQPGEDKQPLKEELKEEWLHNDEEDIPEYPTDERYWRWSESLLEARR